MTVTDEITFVVDWRDEHIYVGDTVLYPRASGRSVEVQEGTVLQIVRHKNDRYVDTSYRDEDGKWVHGSTMVPAHKFQIQPTRSSRFSRSWGNAGEKPVWIQNGENVTRL